MCVCVFMCVSNINVICGRINLFSWDLRWIGWGLEVLNELEVWILKDEWETFFFVNCLSFSLQLFIIDHVSMRMNAKFMNRNIEINSDNIDAGCNMDDDRDVFDNSAKEERI